ncbi:MAG: hypothetical protein NTV19_04030 [Burkholderiales bacterium]|nr:hypothetical protein [Burkholderiales bacterium]
MRSARGVANLLIIAALTLLQGLLPLLHAHPRDGVASSSSRAGAATSSAIHLPGLAGLDTRPICEAPVATITAQDDLRRLGDELQTAPAPCPARTIPAVGDAHRPLSNDLPAPGASRPPTLTGAPRGPPRRT